MAFFRHYRNPFVTDGPVGWDQRACDAGPPFTAWLCYPREPGRRAKTPLIGHHVKTITNLLHNQYAVAVLHLATNFIIPIVLMAIDRNQ